MNLSSKELLIDKFELKNKYVNDISLDLLEYADKNIDRKKSIKILKKFIIWEIFIDDIEKGIFEYSLLFIHNNKFSNNMLDDVYNDKLNDICLNLDTDNTYINNKTLKTSILNFRIKSYFIAFLRPDQLHPTRWIDIIKKRTTREELENNFSTTDIYVCWKCHERKTRVTQKQTRSADEPLTTFIQCMVCLTTFTK